jgi:hypothetical protein
MPQQRAAGLELVHASAAAVAGQHLAQVGHGCSYGLGEQRHIVSTIEQHNLLPELNASAARNRCCCPTLITLFGQSAA